MAITATGLAFDATTREWTKQVKYVARDRMEAIRWVACNRDYLKSAHIVETDSNERA